MKKKKTLDSEMNPGDKISRLPDCLLHYILSFSDTKYAVQTSVLSTRWRYLCRSLPFLSFDSQEFYKSIKRSVREKKIRFGNCVEQVLLLHDASDIQKFRLHFSNDHYSYAQVRPEHFYLWVSAVLVKNVQELDIHITSDLRDYSFPHSLFTSISLIKLKLRIFGYKIYLPDSIFLPNLKNLCLEGLCFVDENLTNKLFISCPVLESLTLERCDIHSLNNLIISAPSLTNLVIKNDYNSREKNHTDHCNIKIEAPNLTSIHFEEYYKIRNYYQLETCSTLKTVVIDVSRGWDDNKQHFKDVKKENVQRIGRFFRAICNVNAISLTTDGLKFLIASRTMMESLQCPNVTNLTFKGKLKRHYAHAIIWFLKVSPNVETLHLVSKGLSSKFEMRSTIDEKMSVLECMEKYWEKGFMLPCILHHLKFVEVQGVQGSLDELMLLGSFLETASVLEKMIIHSAVKERKYEIRWINFKEKLLTFGRASATVEVLFFYNAYNF